MPSILPIAHLPFAPGESPFHLKGNVLVGLTTYLDARVPGGLPAVLQQLPDPPLREFLQQHFLPHGWYDAFPAVPLAEAAALISGVPQRELVRAAARAQAERDIHGVYRFVLKLASPERVCERLPRTVGRYCDFATAEAEELEPRHFAITVRGVPAYIANLFVTVTDEFVATALGIAGARDVRVRTVQDGREPERHGCEILRFKRDVSWG